MPPPDIDCNSSTQVGCDCEGMKVCNHTAERDPDSSRCDFPMVRHSSDIC